MKFRTLIALALLAPLAANAASLHSGADAAVRVQDDLYRAANGGWMDASAIPADKAAMYGIDLPGMANSQVRAIVDQLANTQPKPGTVAYQVYAFYSSYMDVAAIDKAGMAPLRPVLAGIDAIADAKALARWLGRAQGRIETPVYLWVLPGFQDPRTGQPLTMQGGLGLPDRDYYLRDDTRFAEARKAYLRYLVTLARAAGERQPAKAARRVLALEARLAAAHLPLADTRDPGKYRSMPAPELAALAPGFAWEDFVASAALPASTSLTVLPQASQAIAQLFAQLPLADWKLYLKLRSMDSDAAVLPKPLRDARFAFRGTALQGIQAEAPRWQKGIYELNDALGEAVGQLYVERHFPPMHKARMVQLVESLRAAARELVAHATWMTAATRQEALRKLDTLGVKVGYPDQWRDYSGLLLRPGDALGNRHRAAQFAWHQQVAKAGKPVDRKAWMMTPQTVNAMYDPMLNEIVFPAAHLQAPYFDPDGDAATNYGMAGVLIAHEISHAFDNMGSQFDASGAMRNWWSDADRKAFGALGDKLATQFNAYQPLPGHAVNGRLTLDENLADLSGLQIAFHAYQQSLGGTPAPVLDGYSGAQRFFLGYAQSRRAKLRDEAMLRQLTADPHAPPQYRTNGPAVNVDAFHQAFDTKPGDGMYKSINERIHIW
ncbi:MAG TPA: M13 family metallopeptidase [Pseudoduganella sp.]